ncbi:sigma-like protein [Streptomyces fradiae]|uniref:sigma-like protein n=1 Tax=Streptomyces fradiae TaxID=1906 RepID=UPI00379894ED
MSEILRNEDITTLDSHAPAPPAGKGSALTVPDGRTDVPQQADATELESLDSHAPAPAALDDIATMDSHAPAPPAR